MEGIHRLAVLLIIAGHAVVQGAHEFVVRHISLTAASSPSIINMQ